MYSLAFRTYLEDYVRGLSLCGSGRIRVLAREAESGANPRLVEPLVVLAAVTGRMYLLGKEAVAGGVLETELALMSSFSGPGELVSALRSPDWTGSGRLRVEYYKVWESYSARALESDDSIVRHAMRERVLRAKAASGETYYAMAKATGMNQGAVWDLLARGNLKRLSRGSLRMLVEHAEGIARTSPDGGLDELKGTVGEYLGSHPARTPKTGRLSTARV